MADPEHQGCLSPGPPLLEAALSRCPQPTVKQKTAKQKTAKQKRGRGGTVKVPPLPRL